MATVFISYSRSNAEFARRLADDLKALSLDPWLDVDRIQAGEDWDDAVWEGLRACDVMLLLLSPASMASKEVSNEWKYHLSQGKPLIPVLVDSSTNIHYRLAALQYIDFSNNEYNLSLKSLIKEIERVTGNPGAILQPDEDDAGVIDESEGEGVAGTGTLPDMQSSAIWERTTTRIDPAMATQLEEKLHYFNEKMTLELVMHDDHDKRVQARVGRGRDYIVGRSGKGIKPDVDLTPLGADTQGISRQHAAFTLDGETLFIKDLNSTNFTYVEGKRLRGNEQLALKSGDRIQFGNMLLTIHFRDS